MGWHLLAFAIGVIVGAAVMFFVSHNNDIKLARAFDYDDELRETYAKLMKRAKTVIDAAKKG